MTTYAVNKIPRPALDTGAMVTGEDPNSSAVNDRVLSMAAKGINAAETKQKAAVGDVTAINAAKTDLQGQQQAIITESLESEEDLGTIQRKITNTGEKSRTEKDLEDFFLEQGIFVEGVDYTPTDIRYTSNILIAEQLFRDRMSKIDDETGTWGLIGDFIDRNFVRQLPIGWYEDVTRRSERKGEELLQAAISMEPREYRQFITNYIDELSQEGVFTEENIFALMQGLEEATNAGYDPNADLFQALAVLGAAEGLSIAGKALRAPRALGSADSVVARIAATEGVDEATEVAEGVLRVTGTSDAETLSKITPKAYDTGTAIVRPRSSKSLEILENNEIIRRVRTNEQKGVYGRLASREQIEAVGSQIVASYSRRSANKVLDYRYTPDILDNQVLQLDFGKVKDAKPYSREADANKALAKLDLPEGKVVQVDAEDATKGYAIRVEQRLDLTGVADPVIINEREYGFVRDTYAKVFGSNASLDNEYLTALANQAEAGATLTKRQTEDFQKSLAKVPGESKRTISRVFKELRDGMDADIKDGYTVEEFKDRFKQLHPEGLSPTQRDIDAYNAVVEFEDAGWLLRANEALTRYVKKGYWSLDLGSNTRANGKKVSDVEPNTQVFNLSTNTLERTDTLGEVPIWKIDVPLPNGIDHVVNPKSVDVLDHADVMGFNSGGRRLNPKAKQFIVLDGDVPKAMMSSFSEKQAREGVEQLSNIQAASRSGTLTDDIIQANNDWNPSITTVDEFTELAATKGWDLDRRISYKERNGVVVDETVDDVHHGAAWDEYVKVYNNRYDDVLMDYGGGENYNVDPVSAILGEFGNATSHYTHRAYTYNAAAAWTKRASQKGSGVRLNEAYPVNDYLNQVQHAEITGNNVTARELRKLRDVIRRRLKMKGPLEQRMEQFGRSLEEFVFNKTGVKTDIKDPSSALMSVGFQHAFGFMNVSQFFMQGVHAASIIAISPRAGAKGAGMVVPLRMITAAPTPEAKALGIKRLAKYSGESEDTIKELVEYIETSGRDIVDNDLIELGTGPSYGVSGWNTETYLPSKLHDGLAAVTTGGKRALDLGLTPFRQGERLSRVTGINTAFFEFKKKYPNISPLSDEGRRWITTREQNLTFNMTSTSRAAFQNGALALPTQWLSYTFRAMESIVLGRGFTAAERGRLAFMLMPMYGLTGMGLTNSADYFTEKFGVEDPELYLGMKYGLLDYLIAEITPVETALATRLAPITGLTDLYDKIVGGEATVLETALGPSGEIISGSLGAALAAVNEAVNGNTVSMSKDALAVLRQPSGLDNIAKGVGILNNGIYRSKSGTILPVEMKTSDALITFMGFAPAEVAEFYSRKGIQYSSDKKFRAFRKQMKKDFEFAVTTYRDDPDTGRALLDAIHTKIALSPFSKPQQAELRGSLSVENKEIFFLMEDLINRERNLSANMTQQTLGGN